MQLIWHAIVSAFSTFSIIPTPRIEWNSKSLSGLLGALPLVGVAIGGIGYLYYLLAGLLELPAILSAAAMTLIPIGISGGIHLDGFTDTVDAISSYGDAEKKRAILKDPHVGAFAVIGIAFYFLFYFSLCASLPFTSDMVILLGVTHVLGRTVGALASSLIPTSTKKGMLHAFLEDASRGNVYALLVWAVLSLVVAAYIMPMASGIFLLLSVCVFFYVKGLAQKQFGGMSGDIAGFCISLTEIVLLLGLVLSERVVTLWF